MKRILATVALGGAMLAASAAAHAGVHVDVGIGVPGVVVAPAPVYHRPVPVYAPQPVYAPPPVAYVPAPVVVRPAPVRYGPPYGHARGWRERQWEHRHDHHRWH
ncbi:hypothetical protein CURE108131_02065 [Cupriavidus respiraculi]|uniref:Uncharacterized protein n=1 Tax=Cupriavidus respiraculi TaxID=195930 RepID=A0ABN7XYP5_9BURK|nr:hypothetical protein [Cupriavidus respiraculi]CAG9166093.1 hypothetical protein LMG21510_00285 [Cupriavidus respiraculi]